MANKLVSQTIIDTSKRALLKYVLISDGSAEANTTLIDASALQYSLNANGKILGAGTDVKSSYRTTIKRVWGAGKANGYVTLHWASDGNTEIMTLHNGVFDYNFDSMGDGAVIPNPTIASSNGTGDILYSAVGLKAGDAMTFFVDLKKDNGDYDAGQSYDPVAFNR